jgi:hypothetical protein
MSEYIDALQEGSAGAVASHLSRMMAVLVLWHAFLFLGLRFFPPFFFFLDGGLHCFFLLCKKLNVRI